MRQLGYEMTFPWTCHVRADEPDLDIGGLALTTAKQF
jgi:hypothetical protein